MAGNVYRRVLQPAREAADLPWVGFHAFRHTCATLLFTEGRSAVQVQRWLGHHSAAFTLATYVHLLDGDLGKPLSLTIGTNRHEAAVTMAASPAEYSQGYNASMSAARPKTPTVPKASPPPAKRQDLARGLPGTDRERAEQRRRFAEEHRETLRRLGK